MTGAFLLIAVAVLLAVCGWPPLRRRAARLLHADRAGLRARATFSRAERRQLAAVSARVLAEEFQAERHRLEQLLHALPNRTIETVQSGSRQLRLSFADGSELVVVEPLWVCAVRLGIMARRTRLRFVSISVSPDQASVQLHGADGTTFTVTGVRLLARPRP